MRNSVWAVVTVMGLLAAPAAHAATINGREHRQRQRIQEGVTTGEVTHREAARLRGEQAGVKAEERLYRRTGGGLSGWERRDLRRDHNRASRDIYRQKHDGQTR